jgi:transcriptional regulator with XRE-family HTH domain
MTLFVNKQIRKFRLAANKQQKELAKEMGISYRLLSNFELGTSYPAYGYIAKLNSLGANIHPSILSPFAQKLTAFIRKRLILLRRTEPRFLEGIRISKQDRVWIQEQMLKQGVYHRQVAEEAGCSRSAVTCVMMGRNKSQRIQQALAKILGYESFEKLIAASRGKEAV